MLLLRAPGSHVAGGCSWTRMRPARMMMSTCTRSGSGRRASTPRPRTRALSACTTRKLSRALTASLSSKSPARTCQSTPMRIRRQMYVVSPWKSKKESARERDRRERQRKRARASERERERSCARPCESERRALPRPRRRGMHRHPCIQV